MGNLQKIPEFGNDHEIGEFMETYNGFELADLELAEIVETPEYSGKKKRHIKLDTEIMQLLDELVSEGVCNNLSDAVSKAVRNYALAVLPDSRKLTRIPTQERGGRSS